jgi:hypothetical protein
MDYEKLYIGNATRQQRDFQYRVSKDAPLRTQMIPPGAQVRISGDLTKAQVDYIVSKEAKYGIVSATSIDQTKGFYGTCYSIDKPISAVKLMMLMDVNQDALVARGREIREQSAVAQSNLLETALVENGRQERLTEVELTLQQEEQDPHNSVPQMSEGFRVIRGGLETPTPPKRRGRTRKAA